MSVVSATTTPDFESGAAGWPRKVQALLDAVLVLSGEHQLDTVLRRIAVGAATIVDAKYAAIGIYDETGAIESFIHYGMDDDTVARIGKRPEGSGLLGELIVASRPIRLDELGTDPRASGYPPNHRVPNPGQELIGRRALVGRSTRDPFEEPRCGVVAGMIHLGHRCGRCWGCRSVEAVGGTGTCT